jgi:hypothetical protein
MGSVWKRKIFPAMLTVLFSYFLIPIALILFSFSRFLRRELKKLMDRYGRDTVVKIFLQGNIKGLLDLLRMSRDETR